MFPLQGEAIEEAVRRETREEAGVPLVAVDIVGSQPWPVGEACLLLLLLWFTWLCCGLQQQRERHGVVRHDVPWHGRRMA